MDGSVCSCRDDLALGHNKADLFHHVGPFGLRDWMVPDVLDVLGGFAAWRNLEREEDLSEKQSSRRRGGEAGRIIQVNGLRIGGGGRCEFGARSGLK